MKSLIMYCVATQVTGVSLKILQPKKKFMVTFLGSSKVSVYVY